MLRLGLGFVYIYLEGQYLYVKLRSGHFYVGFKADLNTSFRVFSLFSLFFFLYTCFVLMSDWSGTIKIYVLRLVNSHAPRHVTAKVSRPLVRFRRSSIIGPCDDRHARIKHQVTYSITWTNQIQDFADARHPGPPYNPSLREFITPFLVLDSCATSSRETRNGRPDSGTWMNNMMTKVEI